MRLITPMAAAVGAMCFAAAGPVPPPDISRRGSPLDELNATVRPLRGGAPEVTAVQVRVELRGAAAPSDGRLRLRVPIVYAGVRNIAERVTDLAVWDGGGLVPLSVADDPPNAGGFPFYRRWFANREVVPPVTITYRMRPFSGSVTGGPQFDLYAHAGGISGGGMALFVLPEEGPRTRLRLRWDLSELAPGSIAASSYGEGDLDFEGTPDDLAQSFYLAGPLGRYVPADNDGGFQAHWLGQPPFDPHREMAWTARAYQYLRSFWRDTVTRSYHVLLRAVPTAAERLGGTALRNSFMVATPTGTPDSTRTGPRGTIFHEIGHYWIGGLSDGRGGSAYAPWFGEGLNVHYTRLLLLRSGLGSVEDYVRDVNASVRGYYTSPYRNLGSDSVARLGFAAGVGPGSAQNQAYVRGSLFFAELDARIRAGSGGRRQLDDVIRSVFERRARGESIDQAALIAAFVNELGPSAAELFDAVIVRGKTLVPASTAFGPCLERREVKYTLPDGEVDGYEWIRRPAVSDHECRTSW